MPEAAPPPPPDRETGKHPLAGTLAPLDVAPDDDEVSPNVVASFAQELLDLAAATNAASHAQASREPVLGIAREAAETMRFAVAWKRAGAPPLDPMLDAGLEP